MLSRACYCWPGSKYSVTLMHDCSLGPLASAASAAEASLSVPRSLRASFLSGARSVPVSRKKFVEGSRVRHDPPSQQRICRAFGDR
jgi:hypothetical protein